MFGTKTDITNVIDREGGALMQETVYRLEFLQPDGRWTGPYCAEWMTMRAFEIREHLKAEHRPDNRGRVWPNDRIFAANPGVNRYVCGTSSLTGLRWWFGRWFKPLVSQGGFVATYLVPQNAIGARDATQVIYMQRRGVLLDRFGEHVSREHLVERIHPTKTRLT